VELTFAFYEQALRAKYDGVVWEEALYLLEAGLYDQAHGLVRDDLAAEAVIRSDLRLLRSILARFRREEVSGWKEGGKVCGCCLVFLNKRATLTGLFRNKVLLDYADCVEKIPALLRSSTTSEDAASELQWLVQHTLPDLLRHLSSFYPAAAADANLKQNVALSSMLARALHTYTSVSPLFRDVSFLIIGSGQVFVD
jgi:hypothetical protein